MGSGFGDANYSPEIRIAGQACNSTTWVSDAELVCDGTPPVPEWGASGFDLAACNASDCVINHQLVVEVGMQNSTISPEMYYSCPCDNGSLVALKPSTSNVTFNP